MAANLLPMKGQPAPPNPLNVTAGPLPGTEYLGIPYAISNLLSLPRQASSNELSLAELDAWFGRCDDAFAQLREAGKRPKARRPGDYSSPIVLPVPNFVAIRNLAQTLMSRAKVHLLLGESEEALEDLDTVSVVMKSLEAEPGTLVTAMINVAIAGLYNVTVEEGLRYKLWHEPELKNLIDRLQKIDLLTIINQGLRGERAGVLRYLTALAERSRDPLYKDVLGTFGSSDWSVEYFVFKYSPALDSAEPGGLRDGYSRLPRRERRVEAKD
jgi:hypothetical protein